MPVRLIPCARPRRSMRDRSSAAGDGRPRCTCSSAPTTPRRRRWPASSPELVEEGLQAFNVERLYGGETRSTRCIDAAQTLPMMAPRRVVLVLEAERLLMPEARGKAADEEQARLEAFIQARRARDGGLRLRAARHAPARRRSCSSRQAQVVDCGTIENAADAERWVKARAARDKINARTGGRPGAGGACRHRPRPPARRAGTGRAVRDGAADDHGRGRAAGRCRRAARSKQDFGIANAIRQRRRRARRFRQLGAALDGGAVAVHAAGAAAVGGREDAAAAASGRRSTRVFRTDLALKSSGGDPTDCCSSGWSWSCAGTAAQPGHADPLGGSRGASRARLCRRR